MGEKIRGEGPIYGRRKEDQRTTLSGSERRRPVMRRRVDNDSTCQRILLIKNKNLEPLKYSPPTFSPSHHTRGPQAITLIRSMTVFLLEVPRNFVMFFRWWESASHEVACRICLVICVTAYVTKAVFFYRRTDLQSNNCPPL